VQFFICVALALQALHPSQPSDIVPDWEQVLDWRAALQLPAQADQAVQFEVSTVQPEHLARTIWTSRFRQTAAPLVVTIAANTRRHRATPIFIIFASLPII